MKVNALLSCLIMAILGLYTTTATAAWQCTAWNPTLHLRWTSDLSGSRESASNEVTTECQSMSNYPEAGQCYTTCSSVTHVDEYNPNYYTSKNAQVIINDQRSGVGQVTIPATSRICTARDTMGRMWNRTSYTQNACALALDACMASHAAHGIYHGKCWVVR